MYFFLNNDWKEGHGYVNYESPIFNSTAFRSYAHPYNVFEHDWYPTDSEQTFLNNLKKDPNNKTLNYYLENPIKYVLNKDYFRTSSELDSGKKGNVFLGCSHTFGVGLHLEDTWAYKVNQSIGGEFYNLGIPGGSIQNIFINFVHHISKINIENVFVYIPHPYRYIEFIEDILVNTVNISSILDTTTAKHLSKTSLANYISIEYCYMIYYGFLNAIENLCRKYEINCYFHAEVPELDMQENWLRARDLAHFSPRVHSFIADYFLKLFDNSIVLDSNKIKLATNFQDGNFILYEIEENLLNDLYSRYNVSS